MRAALIGLLSLPLAVAAAPQETAPVPAATAAAEAAFVSPYIEKGLPADAMRPMLIDPELAANVKNNKRLWIGDIMRIGLYSRIRGEFRDNLNFSTANTQKIERFLETSQIWFFVNPTKDAEIKVTLQDARIWGGDGGAKAGDDRAAFFTNGDAMTKSSLGVREAYVQFRNVGMAGLGIQLGRQVLNYGDGRMIGSANWTFGGLSYDGFLIKYDNDLFSSHLFGVKGTSSAANNVPNGGVTNTSAAQGDSYLVGLYNTVKTEMAWLDLYAIGIFRQGAVDTVCAAGVTGCTSADVIISSATLPTQRSNLYTFGARLTNRNDNNKLPSGKRLDFTLEAAFQAGNAADVIYTDASGAATKSRTYAGQLYFAQAGYKVFDDLRAGVQAFYTPGTSDRTGSTIDTFQTLPGPRFGGFPYLNTFNGISENMGMKNLFSPSVSLYYAGGKWGDFLVNYFYEMKATPQDAWYAISGVANTGASGESATNSKTGLTRNLYQEIDLVWMKQFSTYFSIWIGVGYLHAGDAVAAARGADFKADAFMSFIQLSGAL